MSVAARVTFDRGGQGAIRKVDGDRVEVVSDIAFAPGSRPEATLPDGGQRIWLKVHGSRGMQDGSYLVTGRVLNATREMLALLKEAVLDPINGKSSEP